ncbi:hypothetical protein J23TS9_46330 [Paenibacillus sp. J23TS9]|nr:hypothetical protein J23TS9_46330 [Paenibacillus sp. J23TS9]
MTLIVLIFGGVVEYGFQYKKTALKIMHPMEATKPRKELFIERPPYLILSKSSPTKV